MLQLKRHEQQETIPDTATDGSNAVDDSKSKNTLLETTETVFYSTPQAAKTESAVAAPVDLKPVVIDLIPTPITTEPKPNLTVYMKDLKSNNVIPIKPAEPAYTPPPLEKAPSLKTAPDLTRETAPVKIPQRVVDKSDTVIPLDSVLWVMESTPLGIEQELTTDQEAYSNNSSEIESISVSVQIEQESPEIGKKEIAIRVVKDKDKIIFGIANMQVEGDEKKGDLPELNPITTVTQLGETLNFINKLTLNTLLNKELKTENDSEGKEQITPEIVIVVSDEILEFIESIRKDFYFSSEQQVKDGEVIDWQTVTFTTHGENQRRLIIDDRELPQMRQFLIAFDLSFGQDTQDEKKSNLPKQDQSVEEIESLIQEIEAQLEDEISELTMFVSEDLMTFIDNGKKIIEEIEKTDASTYHRNKRKKKNKIEQRVAIFSTDKEISIDLITLKKLMKLLKKKRQIDIFNSSKKGMQAPEEIKRNTKPFQSGNNISNWFICQVIVFLLGLIDSQDSHYNPTRHKFYEHPVLQA